MQAAKLLIDSITSEMNNLVKSSIPKSFEDFIAEVLTKLNQNKKVTNIKIDQENREYAALTFEYENKKCLFRQAKSTPKKLGQFVTIWKRDAMSGAIRPYDRTDDIALVVIATHDINQQGYFIFDKQTLLDRHIFTMPDKDGKRAIRVYAPWIQPQAKQAIHTRIWQIEAFVPIPAVNEQSLNYVKKIFS